MIYLAVCQMAMSRSPALARHLSELLQSEGMQGEVRFAGVHPYTRFPVTDELARTANLIFAADRTVYEEIIAKYPKIKAPINLDIQDVYIPDIGEFSRMLFEPHILDLRETYGLEESARVVRKQEIVERWNLRKVLESRNLKQYLTPTQ
jgi:predicted protein tyrosine phosphatase